MVSRTGNCTCFHEGGVEEEVGTEPGSDFPGVSFDSQALEQVSSPEADSPSTLRIALVLPELLWALLLTRETAPPMAMAAEPSQCSLSPPWPPNIHRCMS